METNRRIILDSLEKAGLDSPSVYVHEDMYGTVTIMLHTDDSVRELANLIHDGARHGTWTTTEMSCDDCGIHTDNGNGHYLEELGTEDRLCSDCYNNRKVGA